MSPLRRWIAILALTVATLLPADAAGADAATPAQDYRPALEHEEQVLTRGIAGEPNAIGLYSRRGDVRLFQGRFAEAVADFEKMIALDPAQDAPHWRLGIAYYLAGSWAKSAAQFIKYQGHETRDRENGIWHYMAQAKEMGPVPARAWMLRYTQFDREPFPDLYEMFGGTKSPADVLAATAKKGLVENGQVMFFAHYYIGVEADLAGQKERAVEHMGKAVSLFTESTANTGGPGYMWRVARAHLALVSEPGTAKK